MADITQQIILGIDVAKHELVMFNRINEQRTTIENDAASIRTFLRSLNGAVSIGLEPTSHYHREVAEQAVALGHTVYLVNPRQLMHYREGVNRRNKTDAEDAYLLARFVAKEASELRAFTPQCAQAQQLWALLKRRAGVVAARKQLQQSLSDLKMSAKAMFTQFAALLRRIDKRLDTLARALGWSDDVKRCRSIPGIGPLNAVALVAAFHRGAFANGDAFVAFIGLDVRVRESGTYKGKRRLSKRGDAELRRLLYCASIPARAHVPFARYHQKQLDKGLSKIAANVILSRKLVRIAFAILSNKTTFNSQTKKGGYEP